MSGGKAKPPKTPDYGQIARIQGDESRQTALWNAGLANPNFSSPYGSYTYSMGGTGPGGSGGVLRGAFGGSGGSGPRPTASFTLTPEQQRLFEGNQSYQGGLQALQQASLGRYNDSMGDLAGSRQRIEDSLYNRQTRYLDPQMQQRQGALDSSLANEGVFRGSTAFDQAQDQFGNQRDEAYADARDRAILGGSQEDSRLRELGLGELQGIRGLYNYIYPFQGMGPNSSAGATPSDIYGAAQDTFQGNLARTNARNAGSAGTFNSLLGLIGLGSLF